MVSLFGYTKAVNYAMVPLNPATQLFRRKNKKCKTVLVLKLFRYVGGKQNNELPNKKP